MAIQGSVDKEAAYQETIVVRFEVESNFSIQSFCSCRFPQSAERLRSILTCTNFYLQGLGEARRLDDAFDLVEALESGRAPGKHVELTDVHLNTLVNACAHAGQYLGEIIYLL